MPPAAHLESKRCRSRSPPPAARAFLALVASLPLTDWFVDRNNPNCATGNGSQAAPFCDIGDAVQAAADGDTIRIAPGTYVQNLSLSKDLALIGTSGKAVTIVDGNDAGSVVSIFSSFRYPDGVDPWPDSAQRHGLGRRRDLLLLLRLHHELDDQRQRRNGLRRRGLVRAIRLGRAQQLQGQGQHRERASRGEAAARTATTGGSPVSLTNSTVIGNVASQGSALSSAPGQLTGCTVSGNTATSGAAICTLAGVLLVNQSAISNNTGTGIAAPDTNLTIRNSTISGNAGAASTSPATTRTSNCATRPSVATRAAA